VNYILYPAQRAVEHATAIPGICPVRFFRVLWPLWQVETTGNVLDEQSYDFLDRFLVRGVLEAGWSSGDELARFYGMPRSLVDRCLAFLVRIGHVELDGGLVGLTDLGIRSAREEVRLVRNESRQRFRVERFTHRPLPRRYYHESVHVLPTPAVGDGASGRGWFQPLFAATPFRPEVVEELEGRDDRAEHNVPERLRNLRVLGVQDGYLPAYLVETTDGDILAYTAVSDERDAFLEAVCREAPTLRNLLDGQPAADPGATWTGWLSEQRHGTGILSQLPSGIWRATFEPDAFGEAPGLPPTRLGSFELRANHFLQIWCADDGLRRRTALERSIMLATSVGESSDELMRRAAAVARQLEVTAPGLDEIWSHAESTGRGDRLRWLEKAEAERRPE
jgi:hypothetical protein